MVRSLVDSFSNVLFLYPIVTVLLGYFDQTSLVYNFVAVLPFAFQLPKGTATIINLPPHQISSDSPMWLMNNL